MPPTTLVTGGAGFIGAHVVREFTRSGSQVVIVDDLSRGSRAAIEDSIADGARIYEVDVTDEPSLTAVMMEERPDVVVHLAGQVDVRRSLRESAFDARVNIEGTINVLESARRAGARRVVHSSTAAVYGHPEALPATELAVTRPISAYGYSKLAAEGYCSLYCATHGLSTASLRFSNVYGPGQDPGGEAGVIAILCRAAARGDTPSIFGDGGQTRDFVNIADVTRAIALASGSQAQGPINIATASPVSIVELLEQLRALAPGLPEAVLEPARTGEVRHSCLDHTAATRLLGWAPTVRLAEGLARTLDWLTDESREPASV